MRSKKFLQDKRILVTGASRGIGRAMAVEFAARGAKVAFNYSRDEKSATQTEAAVRAAGAECLKFQVSVLDGEGLNTMVRGIESAWEGIDVLVNNAGISQPFPFALLEEEDWDKVINTNLKGYYMLARAVVPGMIRHKAGVILNIGSLAGLRLIASPAHYSASKAAAKGLTESLCKDLERYNIRVNCLAPGLLDDGVGRNIPESRLKDYIDNVSLGRLGTVEEVARFAAFLVSDRNTYMNGTTILMDGGL